MPKHILTLLCTLPDQAQVCVRVWFDPEWEEYCVKVGGATDDDETYYTSELDDATGTAKAMFASLLALRQI